MAVATCEGPRRKEPMLPFGVELRARTSEPSVAVTVTSQGSLAGGGTVGTVVFRGWRLVHLGR
jgi:hypothetical protein